MADIEVLAAALNPRGTREAALLVSLRERLPALGRFFADAPARNRRGRRKGATKVLWPPLWQSFVATCILDLNHNFDSIVADGCRHRWKFPRVQPRSSRSNTSGCMNIATPS